MTGYESDILLVASDGRSDCVLDSGNFYHVCGDKRLFSTYTTCDGGLLYMTNNTPARVVGK